MLSVLVSLSEQLVGSGGKMYPYWALFSKTSGCVSDDIIWELEQMSHNIFASLISLTFPPPETMNTLFN